MEAVEISGVRFYKTHGSAVCYIDSISSQLENIIRNSLVNICHGLYAGNRDSILYSYHRTVKEFLRRYESKPEHIRKGLIGELLTHLVINTYLTNLSVVTPYFNMEERSIRKGFDLVLNEKKNNCLLFTEVKSGGKHSGCNEDQTISDLIHTAKNDLANKLNNNPNDTLWYNAINAAKLALDCNRDLKDVVTALMIDYAELSANQASTCKDYSVFLSGVLFSTTSSVFNDARITTLQSNIQNQHVFRELFILALQKSAYDTVYNFLKSEVAE